MLQLFFQLLNFLIRVKKELIRIGLLAPSLLTLPVFAQLAILRLLVLIFRFFRDIEKLLTLRLALDFLLLVCNTLNSLVGLSSLLIFSFLSDLLLYGSHIAWCLAPRDKVLHHRQVFVWSGIMVNCWACKAFPA